MTSIRQHLCRVASQLSDQSLAAVASLADWQQQRPQRYRQYLEMQGLPQGLPAPEDRTDLAVTITRTLKRDDCVIHNLHFQPLPRLYITANLYLPPGACEAEPVPAVLYLCGHARSNQKANYQHHARRWVQLGFACFVMDTIEFGESPGDHHGPYNRGQFHWYSRGYSPGATEMFNAIRAIDLLEQRPEVDATRVGVTGISGGGGITWWVAAADPRVKAAAPVCGTSTTRCQTIDRCWDEQCDCMWFTNTRRWDLSDAAALVAPRPLLIASAEHDQYFNVSSVHECYQRVRRIYELHDAAEHCQLIVRPGPHAYHEDSTRGIFSFFLKHLMGVDKPAGEIDDVGPPVEDPKDLQVYENGPPGDERTSTIQDDLIPLAPPVSFKDEAAMRAHREQVIADLREQTFGHFPEDAPGAEFDAAHVFETKEGVEFTRLLLASEPDVVLAGRMTRPVASQPGPAPGVMYLHDPPGAGGGGVGQFDKRWVRLTFEPRGTGETAWAPELDWHMRRTAVLNGRTVASMQVYDTLRAIEAMRKLDTVDGKRITLIGRGPMAAVALYAALLDGGLEAIVLIDPPATQNLDDRQGTPGIEMLNCLRFTDLPDVAAMLYPADLAFTGHRPSAYARAEGAYRAMGGRVVHAMTFPDYHPRPWK